ncbi:MAG: WYL domain-containing protein [Acidobacteria bacterium]|jgi:predicted DNA-binding transcriptional regulator YafY|nr:WYL domain-containing protein [Acidobacteriota bacterium]
MSKRLSYERYLWFHQKLKKGIFPRLKDLMEKFEISKRQAAREIENMRLYFNAPLEYSNSEMGYYYSDDSFEFPASMITEEEIISLMIAKRLSVTIPDEKRKRQLEIFFDNLSNYFDFDIAELEKKISLKNLRYHRVSQDIFDVVLESLKWNRKLKITYHSIFSKEISERTIDPLHLILYMGNWHIIAYCEMKKGIRDFALSRIKKITQLDEPIEENLKTLNIKEDLAESYGIFFEGTQKKVVLKFNDRVADYVREQVWFPFQAIEEDSSGGLMLTFYVTDYREIVREVLSFGADVEVLEPAPLREIIKRNIQELSAIY